MEDEFWSVPLPPSSIRLVDSIDGEAFQGFLLALQESSVIALDAEWKPVLVAGMHPRVSLLQIACRKRDFGPESDLVFIVDVLSIPASALLQPLEEALETSRILKLGFKLRQDLINLAASLSSTASFSCEPYIDIGKLYHEVKRKNPRKLPGDTPSLSHICRDVFGRPLCKSLQCSDWELRPLTEEQISYAAADAHCLLAILDALHPYIIDMQRSKAGCPLVTRFRSMSKKADRSGKFLAYLLTFQQTLSLQADPKKKIRTRRVRDTNRSQGQAEFEWCGPPPWDPVVGGDGCPKFLCDIMIEGLARQLRCVGIDAACPHRLKPDARQLIEQAQREGRILLTRDVKLLRQRLIPSNQAYRVKHLTKKEQLTEIIETFHLTVSEEHLLSRCTRCNGELCPKPLTAQQAKAAAPNQKISEDVLLQDGLLFWQCSECRHLYWQVGK
ncbi:hypothetical protein SELMODRAFT_122415 [Selaginella moellendorffii]|uniref:3'-5' exonuclease domain-containing protein n=1 Tax=Selaginella moellendorffii TaxID=88036 RepID=D8SQC3_SELML|nr:hypothetical protein SELMODRAFT_122415 [Selaginella moellendorffii]